MEANLKHPISKETQGYPTMLQNTYASDVYFISYPRSGSTWLRQIMAYIIHYNTAQGCYGRVRAAAGLWRGAYVDVERVVPDLHKYGGGEVSQPRIFKSHKYFSDAFPKVVYILRDGRDVAVSKYYYMQKTGRHWDSFGDFLEHEPPLYTFWHAHVNGWLFENVHPQLIVVKYEDLLLAPATELRRVCDFVGIQVPNWVTRRALNLSGIGRMQQRAASLNHVHSGGSNWEREFGGKEKDIFKARTGDLLVKLGYSVNEDW